MMTRYPKPRYKKRANSFLSGISLDWMLATGSVALIVQTSLDRSPITYLSAAAFLVLAGIAMGYADRAIGLTQRNFNYFLQNWGKTGVFGIIFGVFALTSLFFALAEPSQALFLIDTEKAVTTLLTKASGSAVSGTEKIITGIFALLRLLMLVVILTFAWKMFQARDDQEDMKNLARTPILVIVVSSVADVAAGFISA